MRPAEERHRHAYEVSLPLIETALAQKAKLDATEFREFAVRGLIEAGIDDAAKDIKAVMRLYREHGVRQNGEMTRIWFGKDVPKNGKERWSVTTAMHVDDERAVVSLARELSADRSGALSHDALERASQAFLASHPKVNPNSDQWKAQRQVIEQLGSWRPVRRGDRRGGGRQDDAHVADRGRDAGRWASGLRHSARLEAGRGTAG